jgi:chemotaxis regulatin CheY-phosphate phosphatase CheZ
MANTQSPERDIHKRVVEAVELAWEQGCPVAQRAEETASIAVRRWRSSVRRKIDNDDLEARVLDLAKGLIAAFEKDPSLVGPLKEDYLYLSRKLADVLRDS